MKHVKLFEDYFINESVAKSMEDFLISKDWTISNTTSTPTIGGSIYHTDFTNKYYKDFKIRIVESPINGTYVEIYENGKQVTPMYPPSIKTLLTLEDAMKTYLKHNMKKFGV